MTAQPTTTSQPTTTYHQVCPQWYSIFEVSSSSPGNAKTYMVITNGPGGMHFCNCPAFRYSGGYGGQHCKHIDSVLAHGCFFIPGVISLRSNNLAPHGIHLIDSAKNATKEVCPGCGEPMIKEQA